MMKISMVGLALIALALFWVGYRMDSDYAAAARVCAWLASAGLVVGIVLGLLRRA